MFAMIQEGEESPEEERRELGCQWESPEEERREVGCQWESPEEERREVGCQSDSAERRDAAVQVDLLSQQLSWRHTGVCGVAWRCVSVRADEPGGGALLQHCRTHHSLPLGHTQLPTMPLFQSPASPEFKEPQQTTSLPSMPLCEPLLLLPPADIPAPPSGLIAPLSPHLAEEEVEEVEGEDGVMVTEQAGRPRRKTVGPPIRYLLESEEQSHGLSVANHSRGVTVEEKEEEEVEEEEKVEKEEEVEKNEEVDGVKPVKTAVTEQAGRPRRKRVGPPIRYLLESEEQSHHNSRLSVANHSRGVMVEEEEKVEEKEVEEVEEKEEEEVEEKEVEKEVEEEVEEEMEEEEVEEKEVVEEVEVEEEEVEEVEVEEKEGVEEEVDGVKPVKTVDTEQAGRPRRKTVGPPIRYLLESEEQSHGLSATNHSIARGAKVKLKPGRLRTEQEEQEEKRGGVELCQVCGLTFTCESSLQLHLSVHSFTNTSLLHHHHHNKQEEVNNNSDGERMERRDEEGVKTLLPVSTKASDWLRCRKRVCRNPRWWIDFCTTMRRRRQERDGARGRKRRSCREEEKQEKGAGGGEEKVEEQPQRPRRTRVGPPIRYLLESEELSHGPITANQERVNRLKESGGRPNKVGIECEAGGGASERHHTLLPASTKAADWLRRRALVRRNSRWWVDYRTTMRRRQDRDGARGRKRRRCREEEENEKGRGSGEEKEEEEPQRPRRTRVGPPIRYLLESEELSHGPTTANQDRARGWREGRKLQKMNAEGGASDDAAIIDTPEFTEQSGRTNQDRVNRLKESGGRPNKVGIEFETGGGASERHKTLLQASTKATDWLRRSELVRRSPRWWVDFRTTMRRRREERDGARGRKRKRCREEEEQEKGRRSGEEKEEEQPQRPRRTRVGPPIRYLLESEELSHGPITANQDRAGGWREGRKPQKKIDAEGGASERHKTLLPASTKATDSLRRRELVRRNSRWWVDYRTTMRRRQDRDGARGRKRRRCREEEEDTSPPSLEEEVKEEVKQVCLKEEGGGEEDKGGEKEKEEEEEERQTEVKKEEEQPQRTMVSPPIRYLLESEELSHGLATAYQDRVGEFKEGGKPQKKSQMGGGASDETAMIDRPEDTDRQAERQMGLTNQDRLDGPHERGGSPNKVMIHRETRGGASEMTDRATPVSDRQTGSYRRSYLVYINLQSSQVTVLSPCSVRLQRLPLIG